MILRAVFWIAVVSFFMPREPDLGYGRPGGEAGIAGLIDGAQSVASESAKTCGEDKSTCVKGLAVLDMFQGMAVNSLDEVKADIEQSKHKRLLHIEQLAAL
jgi:hypothetical protein